MNGPSKLTLAYVRKRATANMGSRCKIERVMPPVWDEVTSLATAGSRQLIYEGVCRIWEISGGSMVQVEEDIMPLQSTQLSIPWDVAEVPKRDDEVIITASNTDSAIVGLRYKILDVARAGDLRPTRRFTIAGVAHSGSW